MEDKELRKVEQLAMRCRTAYHDLLKVAADMNGLTARAVATVATCHLTTAATKVNAAVGLLNNTLAENGVFLEVNK